MVVTIIKDWGGGEGFASWQEEPDSQGESTNMAFVSGMDVDSVADLSQSVQ